jgi:hypothetical protein
VQGRVIDNAGRPIAGARVRLYRRDSRWERRNRVDAETTSAQDGAFSFATLLRPRPVSESRGLSPYVLLADFAGRAVGWREIPRDATTFEGDIRLRPASERTIAVVDADGRPVQGAKVAVTLLGGPLSPLPDSRDQLELSPIDGPLVATTGADNRATLQCLAETRTSLIVAKSGFAEAYAQLDQGQIRLTPGASLSGRLIGPGGEKSAKRKST